MYNKTSLKLCVNDSNYLSRLLLNSQRFYKLIIQILQNIMLLLLEL